MATSFCMRLPKWLRSLQPKLQISNHENNYPCNSDNVCKIIVDLIKCCNFNITL